MNDDYVESSDDSSTTTTTPSDTDDQFTAEPGSRSDLAAQDAKELKTLDSYLKSLPYECESTPEMEDKLKMIVEKLTLCVKTNSWALSVGWDHMLQ
jgi:proteasome activator subunit 4